MISYTIITFMALSMNVLELLQAPTPPHTLTLIGCFISYKLIQNLDLWLIPVIDSINLLWVKKKPHTKPDSC